MCGQCSLSRHMSPHRIATSSVLLHWNVEANQWLWVPYNLGEFHLSAAFEEYKQLPGDTLLLFGDVHYPIPHKGGLKPAAGIAIWKAEPISERVMVPSEELGVTDSLGHFVIRVYNPKRVIFVETDSTAVGYTFE